jgi:hypothetical protein
MPGEMRDDVSFQSNGTTCRGWFYRPNDRLAKNKRAPAIVMSHGFSAVKEQSLDRFAAVFNAAGFAVLAFDYRFLGSSDGTPRQRVIPAEQHDDLRAALGWIAAREEVDPERIGMWGTSYSGGHTLVMAALDPRIKVAVAQVAAVDLLGTIMARAGKAGVDGMLGMFVADHAARNAGQPGPVVPVIAEPGGAGVLATQDSYEWFQKHATAAPTWKNEVAAESLARLVEYAPKNFVALISPKPLLMLAATQDSIIPIAQTRAVFASAGEPKKLEEFDCRHFDFYDPGPHHDRAVAAATEWFKQYL